MPFQRATNALQAPGVAGDFASANPRATVNSTQFNNQIGVRAGANGLTIGLFAWWDLANNYMTMSNSGAGAPAGFVHRDMTALITTYLTEFGMTIPAGMMASGVFDAGDFFVVNNGSAMATPGMKAYANNVTGVATFAATGAPTTGGTGTASTVAAGTGNVTGTIVDGVLNAVSALTGTLVVGGVLSGTGVAAGTRITSQLTGTAGGLGTYTVSPGVQTVASTVISETYGTLTVGGTVTGTFAVGQTITGSGVTAGSTITALGTGVGGAGTYITQTQTVGSTSISSQTNTETGWFCRSIGLAGELVIISSRAMG